MKITVKRIVEPFESWFKVYADNDLIKLFSFKHNEPEDSIYNEEANRQSAIRFAENYQKPSNETIYENEI